MKEATLRKWHRSAGIVLAAFIVIQAATGILLSIEDITGDFWGGHVQYLHYRFRPMGDYYRIALGLGLLWMAGTGAVIWARIGRRARNTGK